ncbi:MAG TPA: N-acetylmuramoyl-L-alanine amidase [Brevefilum sp.]|nr:N-acetylmuramoyl-L-alanine amidase [Brevefilum sp.]HOR19617.1 N-acetylmuramoyl-L-alanine amidase [Brevefilum sp.]HPL70236.1 N-acetylmuramoyl-L-alanine amidase [Brevefilum sp.]
MSEQTPADEQTLFPEEPINEEPPKHDQRARERKPHVLTFWSGLTTVLASAFLAATLFTIWTPGSVVDSSLQARMAQVLEPDPAGDEILASTHEDSEDSAHWDNIGIVAGHYGFDSGAVCPDGVTEVELNLKIATLVQKMLADQGYQVDLLQEFDQRLQGYQAAVLISIHLDSCAYINDQATGFKVASALSARDAVDSQRLTQCLAARYGEITGLPYHAGSVTNDMTYYHAFNEIDIRTMAAIIEAGFMNLDYPLITEQTERVAEGIVAGILCFLNNEPLQPVQNP